MSGSRAPCTASVHHDAGDESFVSAWPAGPPGSPERVLQTCGSPSLYRILALRGRRVSRSHAFTLPPRVITGGADSARGRREHVRGGPNQIGEHPGGLAPAGPVADRRPVGAGPGRRPGHRDRDRRRSRPRRAAPGSGRGCRRAPPAARPYTWDADGYDGGHREAPAVLDARCAFSRARAFTPGRVSDIADEAGVAYGLVYHYSPPRSRSSTRCSSSAGT